MKCGDNCKTSPAHYSKLITIQKPKATGQDEDYGKLDLSLDSSWEQHTKAYAKVLTKGGREFFQASQVRADLSHMWEVPSSGKVRETTTTMRIKWNDRTFQILASYDKDENRRTHIIETKEKV